LVTSNLVGVNNRQLVYPRSAYDPGPYGQNW